MIIFGQNAEHIKTTTSKAFGAYHGRKWQIKYVVHISKDIKQCAQNNENSIGLYPVQIDSTKSAYQHSSVGNFSEKTRNKNSASTENVF